MFEDPLDPVLRQALSDRFEASELAEMLGLTALQILIAFPDEVDALSNELRDMCGLEPEGTEDGSD